MSRFTIDRGIPIPDGLTCRARGGSSAKYPFVTMEVGDSFLVPGKTKMGSTVRAAAIRTGFKFLVVPENGGTRIFRVPGVFVPRPHKPKIETIEPVAAVEPVALVEPKLPKVVRTKPAPVATVKLTGDPNKATKRS